MGLFSFVKSIGEKLSGGKKVTPDGIKDHVNGLGLKVERFMVSHDEGSDNVDIFGWVADLATKEKLILAIGNLNGIGKVTEHIRVGTPPAPVAITPAPQTVAEAVAAAQVAEPAAPEPPAPESTFHTVEKGDTLSKIAKEVYGNANLYNAIFEANKPMLTHPDKIFPGQVLRIPPLEKK